jgi:hypothetical protein
MQPLLRLPRRWLALAALAVAVFVVPTASAGSAAAIKGVGAGKMPFGFVKFELSAHAEDDPSTPENGFGQVKFEVGTPIPIGSVTIDVRCVRAQVGVTGRPNATITGRVTQSTVSGFFRGHTVRVDVSDGGEPASDLPVDSFQPSTFEDREFAETACLEFLPIDPPPNVEQGNIVVKF